MMHRISFILRPHFPGDLLESLSPLNKKIVEILQHYGAQIFNEKIHIPQSLAYDLGVEKECPVNQLNMIDGFVNALINMLQTDGRFCSASFEALKRKGLLSLFLVNVDTTIKKDQSLKYVFTQDGKTFEVFEKEAIGSYKMASEWQTPDFDLDINRIRDFLIGEFERQNASLIEKNEKAYKDAYWKLLNGSVDNDDDVDLDEEIKALQERFQIRLELNLIQIFNCV
jgi:hypothetical protein